MRLICVCKEINKCLPATDTPLSPMGQSSPNQEGLFTDLRLMSLEKQLNIELKVKQGAENMIQSLTSGHRDKKLLQEAQQMLDDSRAKIEFLRMRIMKVRQARHQQQHARGDAPLPNGETTSNKGNFFVRSNRGETIAVLA